MHLQFELVVKKCRQYSQIANLFGLPLRAEERAALEKAASSLLP